MTKFSKKLENTVTSNFSFSFSGFKRLILQTRENQGLFGKGLNTVKRSIADVGSCEKERDRQRERGMERGRRDGERERRGERERGGANVIH